MGTFELHGPCQGQICFMFARGPIHLGSGDDLNIPERDRSSVGGCSSAVEHGSPKPERQMNLSPRRARSSWVAASVSNLWKRIKDALFFIFSFCMETLIHFKWSLLDTFLLDTKKGPIETGVEDRSWVLKKTGTERLKLAKEINFRYYTQSNWWLEGRFLSPVHPIGEVGKPRHYAWAMGKNGTNPPPFCGVLAPN